MKNNEFSEISSWMWRFGAEKSNAHRPQNLNAWKEQMTEWVEILQIDW